MTFELRHFCVYDTVALGNTRRVSGCGITKARCAHISQHLASQFLPPFSMTKFAGRVCNY